MEINNSKQEEFKDIINLIKNKSFKEAEDALNKLLNENKNDFYIHQLLGIVYQNTLNFDKSVNHFNLSLNIMPKNAGVLYNLGIINRQLNNLEKAKEYFLKSIKVNPNFIDGHINVAMIYEIENQLFEAEEHFKHAFAIKKDYTPLNRAYIRFLMNSGEIKKGLSLMYKNFGNIRFGTSNLEII